MSKNRDLEHEFEKKFASWRVAQTKQELLSLPKRAQLDVLTKVVLERLVKEFGGNRDGERVARIAGNPPLEPLPGEIEAELPWFLREERDE